MPSPTQAARQAFLSQPHIGVLAIARPGRGPLTAPIWYDYEPGGDLRIMLGRESRKAKLLEVGTRVSLCAQKEEPPYAYVTAEGPVTHIAEGTGEDILRLAARYLGEEGARQYADGMDVRQSLTLTIRPETWLAVDYAD